MLRYHMAVVTRDNALKRAIKRLTTSTGSTADFIGDATGFNPERPASLVIFDARQGAPDKLFFDKAPRDAKIIYIIEGDSLIAQVPMFKDDRVVSLFCYDAQFDDEEFIVTVTKALRGEIFGLQKYFPWGVTSFSMVVENHEQKTQAIDIMLQYANLAAVRGPVRDRIQLVCDELMMNALYHAPTDKDGKELYAGKTLKELAQLDKVNAIEVRYGCTGRYFGVSVRDGGGSLTRARALEYLRKAAQSASIETKSTGAGLGLVSVLKSVSKLVMNLQPGESTEVVALFDMELFSKGKVGARSLHLFTAPPSPPEPEEVEADNRKADAVAAPANQEAEPPLPPKGRGAWVFAALLFGLAVGMGVAVLMQRQNAEAAAAVAPTLIVNPNPPDAVVKLGDKPIQPREEVPIPDGGATLVISKPGYKVFTTEVSDKLGRSLQINANLVPSK